MQADGLIATFGEVFLKGRNRQRFIDRIAKTAGRSLSNFPDVEIRKTHANLKILLNGQSPDPVVDALQTVFGIQRCQLYTHCPPEIEKIETTTLEVVRSMEADGKSIKIVATRGDKRFPLTSPEIASRVGRYVGEHSSVPIDMHDPDIKVKIQIQRDGAFIISKEYPCSGGLPIGINGRALLMLSGGLDSPVAGYLVMKRGLELVCLHFDSPPYTSPRARQKVFDLAEKLAHYMPDGKMDVHVVPFTQLQKAIFEHVPEQYGMTVMRRMMYRIAERIAGMTHCTLLANGESLGQVASQTPQSMQAINAVTCMPVIRPLACMDKLEIIQIARRINTHDISIRPYEDCCTVFVPKSPATSPRRSRCERAEELFDWNSLLETCIAATEKIALKAGTPIQIDSDTRDEICSLL